VDDKDHQVPFAFNGRIDKLTVDLKRAPMTAEEPSHAVQPARKFSTCLTVL